MKRAIGLLVGGVFVLAVAVGALWHWGNLTLDTPGKRATEIIVELPSGTSLSGISARLQSAGAIERAWLFQTAALISGDGRRLKAGEYAIAANASPRDILSQIASGEVLLHTLTIPEGLSVQEIMLRISGFEPLSGALPPPPSEGSLLPETYSFPRGESRTDLLNRMLTSQQALLNQLWPDRATGLPLDSPAQALVLASIVEKETGVAAERSKVAGVFYNRLRLGMALQSDPTVVYARDRGVPNDAPISRADLAIDSPYNTYKQPGLPPAPIANPGRAAIHAVLHPEATDALYFVADGGGGHAFAKTLDEHNRNVANLRKRERESAK